MPRRPLRTASRCPPCFPCSLLCAWRRGGTRVGRMAPGLPHLRPPPPPDPRLPRPPFRSAGLARSPHHGGPQRRGETKSRGLRRCPAHPLRPHGTEGHCAGVKRSVPFSILPRGMLRAHVPQKSREPHPQYAYADGDGDPQGSHPRPAARGQVCVSGRNKGQSQGQRIEFFRFWSDPKAPSQVSTTTICKILQPRGAPFPLAFRSVFKLPSVTAKSPACSISGCPEKHRAMGTVQRMRPTYPQHFPYSRMLHFLVRMGNAEGSTGLEQCPSNDDSRNGRLGPPGGYHCRAVPTCRSGSVVSLLHTDPSQPGSVPG